MSVDWQAEWHVPASGCARDLEKESGGVQIQRFASFHESKKETISVLNNENEKGRKICGCCGL
jgi:hypothetical protein